MLIELNPAGRTIFKIVLLLTGIGYTFPVKAQLNTGGIHGNFELNAQYVDKRFCQFRLFQGQFLCRIAVRKLFEPYAWF
jgi:hypothetical protein